MNRDLTIHNSSPQQSIPFRATRAAALMLVMVFASATAGGEEHWSEVEKPQQQLANEPLE
jgi:hypothetical protein